MAKSNYSKKSNKNQPTPELAVVESIFGALGQLISWAYRSLTNQAKGGAAKVNQSELDALREHWEQVELFILQDATKAQAVAEGDKILDAALKLLGFPGETMADRLRAAEPRFGSELYQEIWKAHKLRNTLAHEVGATASPAAAAHAVTTFRRALYQLSVLS